MYKCLILCLLFVIAVLRTVLCGEFVVVSNNRYYVSYPQQANWYEASRFCTAHGMKLIDITTQSENNNIVSIINQIRFQGGETRRIWTSGIDLGQVNRFHWDSTGHTFSFEDFQDGQPDNLNDTDSCVDINGDDNFKWYDEDCLLKKYFICTKFKVPLLKNCKCINN